MPGSVELSQQEIDNMLKSFDKENVSRYRLKDHSGYQNIYRAVMSFIEKSDLFDLKLSDIVVTINIRDLLNKYFSDILVFENVKDIAQEESSKFLPYNSPFFQYEGSKIAAFHVEDIIDGDVKNRGKQLTVMREDLFRFFNYFISDLDKNSEQYNLLMTGFVLLLMHETIEGIGMPHNYIEKIEARMGEEMGLNESPLNGLLNLMNEMSDLQTKAINDVRALDDYPKFSLKQDEQNKYIVVNDRIVEDYEGVQSQIDYLLMRGYYLLIELDTKTESDLQAFLVKHGLKRYLGKQLQIIEKCDNKAELSRYMDDNVDIGRDVVYVGLQEKQLLSEMAQVITSDKAINNNPFFPILRFASIFHENKRGINNEFGSMEGNVFKLTIVKIEINNKIREWLKSARLERAIKIAA